MAMCQTGEVRRHLERIPVDREGQSDRSHTHHAAASLAVVADRHEWIPREILQAHQTTVPGCPLVVQNGLLDQPPRNDLPEALRFHAIVAFRRYALRVKPAEVSVGERNERIAFPLLPGLIVGPNQALGDEQRHLRVIRESALGPAIRRYKSRDACGTVLRTDFVDRFEFHAGAELITDRSAQQCAPDARGVRRSHSFSWYTRHNRPRVTAH
jgi:hypothetical protein